MLGAELNMYALEPSFQPPQFWCLFEMGVSLLRTLAILELAMYNRLDLNSEIHLSPSVSQQAILILRWSLHEKHRLKNKLLSQPTKKESNLPTRYTM